MHPLNDSDGLLSSIQHERKMLKKLKDDADYVIDTSTFSLANLREHLMDIYTGKSADKKFEVKVISFGFKHGIPVDADMVFDVRCFPNPFYIPELREKTGNDKEVQDYVMNNTSAVEYLKKIEEMIDFLVPVFSGEGRKMLIVAIGCTGGHHRSVTFANKLADYVKTLGYTSSAVHRDIKK